MRRGAWHQFGDRSQRLADELLQHNFGVGVIISPRDLSFESAHSYASAYRDQGAEVLIDEQFYVPHFTNRRLESYPVSIFRLTVSDLNRLGDREEADLAGRLETEHRRLSTNAIISPAVAYEAGRDDITDLNARLFRVAKAVGDNLGIPTYSTIVLGQSITASEVTLSAALAQATAVDADGWYYAFEFSPERVPSDLTAVLRCCQAGLILACTGKPVLHAYAGPMSLLSLGFGVTGVAIGHNQNLWRFTRQRWGGTSDQGGGGEAPPRFFSTALWGTIIYPDETIRLPANLRNTVLTTTEFAEPVSSGLRWTRWDANKHLVAAIAGTLRLISGNTDARQCARLAIEVLERAVRLHGQIAAAGISLRNGTNNYQHNWLQVAQRLLAESEDDYNYLSLLA
jgi:hypothetical protein